MYKRRCKSPPTGHYDKNGTMICFGDILENSSGRQVRVTYLASREYVGYDLKAINGEGKSSDPVWDDWRIIREYRE